MTPAKHPLRERFEDERKRAAFIGFLTGAGIGIIVSDTWISPLLGVPGGFVIGGIVYGLIFGYETFMWRRHHA